MKLFLISAFPITEEGSTVSYSERAAWILLLRFHSIPLLHAGLPYGDRYFGVCVYKYAG